MLKIRVMPTLLYKNMGLVKGIGFDSWRRVGGLMQAIKVYNMRGVDELVFLDITATVEQRPPDFELVDDFADECFMPLTVGGGVRSVEDVRRLLAVGADKVAVNTAAIEDPDLVRAIADRFGSQCVVVSIDVRRRADGAPRVHTHAGRADIGADPVAVAQAAEAHGAGEILLTSIERDGTMAGYDLQLVRSISEAVSIPVIASGGAGGYADLVAAVTEGRAAAVAAASIFHFTESTPREAKLFMREAGLPVRLEPPA
jgi:imidazole glycerol-phosphate synthase subunit HisF